MNACGEMQKVEKSDREELSAHVAMNEISAMFPLTEEQKDQIYSVHSNQTSFEPDLRGCLKNRKS